MKLRNMWIALLVVCVFFFSACGAQSSDQDSSTSADQNISEEAVSETYEESMSSSENYDLAIDTTIEETVLFDDGTVSVKAKELHFNYNSPELTIEIVNQSDKQLQFLAGTLGYSCNSVNGTMVNSGYLNAEVGSGKTAIEEVRFDADELKAYGITEIAEIKMAIVIEDNEDNQDYAITEPVSIRTSAYDKWDQTQNYYWTALQSGIYKTVYNCDVIWSKQEKLFEAENIKIVSSALVKNNSDEIQLLLEIENSSDKIVNAAFSDIDVNGIVLCSSVWTGDTIDVKSKCITSVNINSIAEHGAGSLDALGIHEIGSVGFCIKVEDANNNTLKTEDVRVNIDGEQKESNLTGEEIYNNNGIVICSKDIIDDDTTYYYAVFLISNNTGSEINVDVDYGSLSLNDVMTDSINYSLALKPGRIGAMNVMINKMDAEKNGITSLSEIKNMELVFEIRDTQTYDDIDTPNVKVTF